MIAAGMDRDLDKVPVSVLPLPDADARARSEALSELIQGEIHAAGGAIDFSRFMELSLYAPGLGYYSGSARKFGEQGDFVTAPELGDLFAQCVARQCVQIFAEIGARNLLEFGAGSGALAADLMLSLERQGQVPERYFIIELSADLKRRQRATIASRAPQLADRVHWLTSLPAPGFTGVVLANEVLDAMPVSRFVIRDGEPRMLAVAFDGRRFVDRERRVTAPWVARIRRLGLADGYCSEVCDRRRAWLGSLAACLDRAAVLIFDYGFPSHEYYHPQRSRGTLMCHYRHRAHADPYCLPGLQDISAHVDFTDLAQGGIDSGLSVMGYSDLAAFLISTGLLEALEQSADSVRHRLRTQQVMKLTSPSEMGELFKVIAFGHRLDIALSGFAEHDRRGRL